MSWPDRARLSDHFSATSEAGGEADQSHEVRHGAGRRHRLQIQRLQAGRVTPCTQENSSLISTRGRERLGLAGMAVIQPPTEESRERGEHLLCARPQLVRGGIGPRPQPRGTR